MRSALAASAITLMLLATAQAKADDMAAGAPHPSPSAASSDSGDAVTHWTDVVDGKTIPYAATAGTITLKDDKGDPTASMFYVAYTEDGVTDLARRPVTFLYNGGPGSSTVWLRMGSFGPKRIALGDAVASSPAPYQLVDNEYSLIDKTDLVFVDAVGTGFSRIIKGDPKDFYGVDPDIRAFGQFITRYVTQNGRWNSPKFLFGESYGTPRSCGLVYYLQNQGMQFNGVVLLSSVINFDEFTGADGNDVQFIAYLPTEAAVAWYHHKASAPAGGLPALVAEVKSFAIGEYADALLKGTWLSSSERDDVVQKLHQYTGLSEQFIRDSDLRIQPPDFEKQLLHEQTRITGRLDARFIGIDTSPTGETPDYDPTNSGIDAPYTAVFNDYVRTQLRYHTDLTYYTTNYGVVGANWGFTHSVDGNTYPIPDMMPDLRDAMSRDPHLKIFSAGGYYDMATPFFGTDYLLAHLGIDPSLQKNISYGYYESGHMVYVHVPALAAFKSDLARFYDDAAP